MSTFKSLMDFMKGNKWIYLIALIMVIISVVIGFIPPIIIGFTIDSVIGSKPMDLPDFFPAAVEKAIASIGGVEYLSTNLWLCGAALVILSLVSGVAMFFRGKLAAMASENIAKSIRDRLYNHLQRLSYNYHVNAKTGDLIQRCTSDLETIRRFLADQVIMIGRAITLLVIAISFMLKLDVKMTVVSMTLVPVIFLFSYIYFKKIQYFFKQADESEGRLSNVLQENLTGIRVVRAFAQQQFENKKFDEHNKEYRDLLRRLINKLSIFWSLSDGLSILQNGLIITAGAYWAATGRITVGTLVVFISYENMLLWPLRQMGRILSDIGKMTVSINRIDEILKEPMEDMNDQGFKPDLKGDILFENVSLEYRKGIKVLKNISFTVKKGQTVAILGPTGSGKSSMVHLLQRLYDYNSGSININGVELKKISKKWLRNRIGIVLQEPFLYSRTIKQNINIAVDDATDQQIFSAAEQASIHHVINDFEKGYETVVGERGVTLSGGQKQRVAIARTILRDSDILIFDDSLSAVDTQTDAKIREALKNRSKSITTFIIAHRLNTVCNADLILVMDEGKIIQKGTHNELIKKEGLYKRIWEIQRYNQPAEESVSC